MDKGIDDCDNAIEDLYSVKAAKADIVNVQTNNPEKMCGAALAYAMGQQLSTLNDNLSAKANISDSMTYKTTASTTIAGILQPGMYYAYEGPVIFSDWPAVMAATPYGIVTISIAGNYKTVQIIAFDGTVTVCKMIFGAVVGSSIVWGTVV